MGDVRDGSSDGGRTVYRSLGHQPALDGIRAVAALLVVGYHSHVPGFANGGLGVDVFFTLSGFLITSLLLSSWSRSGSIDLRTFYVRRALRLLPAYLAVVTVAVVADFFIDAGGTLKGAVASFFYVANWAVGALGLGLGSLGHTWSLSIEEQFYLFWPLALIFLLRRTGGDRSRLLRLVVALTALSAAVTVVAVAAGVSEQLIFNATPTRALQLLAGAVLAVMLSGRVPHVRWLGLAGMVALAGLLVLGGLPQPSLRVEILAYWPAVAFLTCVVIASVLGRRGIAHAVLSLRVLTAVGRVSYGLYLWHFVIFTTIDAAVGLHTWPSRILGLVLTAIVVPLSYCFIERPFLRRKDQMGEHGARTTASAGTSIALRR